MSYFHQIKAAEVRSARCRLYGSSILEQSPPVSGGYVTQSAGDPGFSDASLVTDLRHSLGRLLKSVISGRLGFQSKRQVSRSADNYEVLDLNVGTYSCMLCQSSKNFRYTLTEQLR